MKVEQRARAIELILSDVDGVLTDGGIIYDNQGIETKRFHVRDGLGVRLWKKAGFRFGILTARTSHIVKIRASELDLDVVRQGFDDKLPAARDLMTQLNVSPEQVCFIGDDLTDLPVLSNVGMAVAVADGVDEVQSAAHWITSRPGGRGAVRETIEMILKAKNRWNDLIRNYTA